MVTYAQLEAEFEWGREYAPQSLLDLRSRLLARWGLSGSAIGIKGNNLHLRGYHRSREWVLGSAYCTNRWYSTCETSGNRSGGDSRWLAAMDITLPTSQLLEVCKRLDVAVRAGRLEKVTEWYGNLDGNTIVDGYNNIANRVATSDSSHLWHLHMSFDRGRVGEDHFDLYQVLTGDDLPMTPEEYAELINKTPMDSPTPSLPFKTLGDWLKGGRAADASVKALDAKVNAKFAEVTSRLDDIEAKLTTSVVGTVLAAELAAEVVTELGARLKT